MSSFDERDRATVLEDLASPDEEVRRLAVERIEVLGRDEVLPRLVERLGDSDWRVRKAAVRRMAACREPDLAARLLVDALADGENPGRRNAAVEALVELGEKAVDALVASCRDADADVRKFVVDALAGIGSESALAALLERLGDGDPNVRAAAADALGAIGGGDARRALREKATCIDEDPLVRFSALHALDTLEEPLRADELAAVLDDPMLGPAGLGLLGRCDDDPGALEALVKGLVSGVRAARESAMRAVLRLVEHLDGAAAASLRERLASLAGAEPEVTRAAIERLEDCDLGTQMALVQFLGLIRSPDAVIPVLQLGRDEALAPVTLGALEQIGAAAVEQIDAAWGELDVGCRGAACAVLGRIADARSRERLLGALDDADPSLRAAAARALASVGAEAALAPLVRRLQLMATDETLEGDDELRALTDAIVELAGPDAEEARSREAVALLASGLADADDASRLRGARVLGAIARDGDADLVTRLLKDPSPEVRRAAVDAIARLASDRTPEPLHLAIADEAPSVRIAAAQALGASPSPKVFEDLRRLADDEDARVRAVAVKAIGLRFGADPDPERRARALAELNRACDDEAPVALAVAEAVLEIGGDASAYTTQLLARPEPEVVLAAARCVGSHVADSDLEVLLPLVSHADWSVRAEVVEILGERRYRRAVPTILRRLETEQDDFVRSVTLNALESLEG